MVYTFDSQKKDGLFNFKVTLSLKLFSVLSLLRVKL